jgi:hypothetical protein
MRLTIYNVQQSDYGTVKCVGMSRSFFRSSPSFAWIIKEIFFRLSCSQKSSRWNRWNDSTLQWVKNILKLLHYLARMLGAQDFKFSRLALDEDPRRMKKLKSNLLDYLSLLSARFPATRIPPRLPHSNNTRGNFYGSPRTKAIWHLLRHWNRQFISLGRPLSDTRAND